MSKPIEKENAGLLRAEIADAYIYMPFLIRIKARTEAIYRMAQGEFVGMAALKGTGREYEINGSTAHYRYARDFCEGLLDTLNSRLSAAKSILSSLDNERS